MTSVTSVRRWPYRQRDWPWRIDLSTDPSFVFPPMRITSESRYLELDLQIDLPWDETGRYEHSKLYFTLDGSTAFVEQQSVCVHVQRNAARDIVQVVLPPQVRAARRVRFRFDPAPCATAGTATMWRPRLSAGSATDERSRIADLEDLKGRVRRTMADAEAAGAATVEHLPPTLSMELTVRCNLTCTHCSSHGTPELHLRHNHTPEMAVETFERLADEVFPSLTALGLVGRGEPLLVTDRLWQSLCAKLRQHHVRMTLVTNGTMLERRLTDDVMPLLESVLISFDGGEADTFAANRAGTTLDRTLEALATLDRRRRAANLLRRPRIGVTWTLKANNVAELPGFVERAIGLGIDSLTVRHLVVFHAHNHHESVIDRPDLVNGPLRATYELVARHGIRSDCPPLLTEADDVATPKPQPPVAVPVTIGPRRRRDTCMYVYRTGVVLVDGAVHTCSLPFTELAGTLSPERSFGEIWHGAVMNMVRRTLDTPDELYQCTHCWCREGRYLSQRYSYDSDAEAFDLTEPASLNRTAWDFEDYLQ